jgi:hypothetical protein
MKTPEMTVGFSENCKEILNQLNQGVVSKDRPTCAGHLVMVHCSSVAAEAPNLTRSAVVLPSRKGLDRVDHEVD